MPRIHLVSNLPGASALGDHLRAAGLGPTSARSADALLVLIDRPLDHVEQELLDRARQSVPVLLAGPTIRSLPAESPLVEASGFLPGRTTPSYELRLSAGPQGAMVAARMGEFRPYDSWVVPDKVADDVERLLVTRHGLGEQPVCTWRPATGLGMFTLGSGEATLADPAYHRLVGRWLRHALGVLDAPPTRVGLLGVPELVAAHLAGVEGTDGLETAVVCDGGTSRLGRGERAPRRADTPEELLADPDVDLLVVATVASSRADWISRALQAGKNVVVDAPACLSTSEADELSRLAAERSLLLAAYPDRRDDPGFRAVRAAVRSGAIGDVLWAETFQGGFARPAGTWHDDVRTSGGLLYDRGYAHVDWLLDLIGTSVEWVSATEAKRVWHHVTNADHARVLLHFVDGVEAQLTLSDLTLAPRPRFRLLGSAGEILSEDPPEQDATAPTARTGRHAGRPVESVPLPVTLATQDGARNRLPLPITDPTWFYRDLADTLVSGWPQSFRLTDARSVIAVLEAAVRSAGAGGSPVAPTASPQPVPALTAAAPST